MDQKIKQLTSGDEATRRKESQVQQETPEEKRERLNDLVQSLNERIELDTKSIAGLEKLLTLYGPSSKPWNVTQGELKALKKNLLVLQEKLAETINEKEKIAFKGNYII